MERVMREIGELGFGIGFWDWVRAGVAVVDVFSMNGFRVGEVQ